MTVQVADQVESHVVDVVHLEDVLRAHIGGSMSTN